MWGRFGIPIISLAGGIVLSANLVMADTAIPKRPRNYTPQEFRAVLRGFGYKVDMTNTPLSDGSTRQAIREFQKRYRLLADGVAGPKTQDMAALLVSNLQRSLNLVVKPNPPLPGDHLYSPQTAVAVGLFQRQFQLPETGVATIEVRRKIDEEARKIIGKQPAPAEAAPTQAPTKPKPKPRGTPTPQPTSTPQTSPTPQPTSTPQTTPTPQATPTPIGP